jgi:hypothetical protein
MPEDPDDLTPAQRGKLPSRETLLNRGRRTLTGRGRLLRTRSWITILVGLGAVLLCVIIFLQTSR